MRPTAVFLFICCASLSQQVATALSGHHLRKVAVEGSQVRLQCRLPMKSRRMMLMDEPVTIPVVWLRFDMKDPTSQEVISHGDTLLTADANPRMRVSYEEETATSVLIIERAQAQDGGVFQCQMFVEDQVVPSSPIEVIIEAQQDSSAAAAASRFPHYYFFSFFLALFTLQALPVVPHLS